MPRIFMPKLIIFQQTYFLKSFTPLVFYTKTLNWHKHAEKTKPSSTSKWRLSRRCRPLWNSVCSHWNVLLHLTFDSQINVPPPRGLSKCCLIWSWLMFVCVNVAFLDKLWCLWTTWQGKRWTSICHRRGRACTASPPRTHNALKVWIWRGGGVLWRHEN